MYSKIIYVILEKTDFEIATIEVQKDVYKICIHL